MSKGRTRQLSIQPGMSSEMLRLISEQRVINKELDRRKPLTSPTTFFNDSNRPDATTNGGRIIFVRQSDGSFQGQFSDGSVWVSFLASATSFDTPAITYGTTAGAGSGIKTIRHNAALKFPNSLMSTANGELATLSDNGTDMTLATSSGTLNINPAVGLNVNVPTKVTSPLANAKTAFLLRQLATGAAVGAHINFDDKAGDGTPVAGDLWRSGAALNYRKDGATTVDLTVAAGGGITSTEIFLDFGTRAMEVF